MDSDILAKVLAYVDANIRKKLSLCDLAEISGYSPFYFSKLFSETMGMPVTGYIRIRKLQHAVVSLLEGHKVLDVALMYAFDSHEGFTRAFVQLFGSTPSKIRRYLTSYSIPEYAVINTHKRRTMMDTANVMDLQHNMHQLIYEVIEQSLEEARAGFCTSIEVTLLPGNRVKINDNGRGMPLSKDLMASKAVLDKILAGKPITNAEYSQMGDLEQAGMQTVNSLCESLHIAVDRNGNQYQQDYCRGVAQHDLQISNSIRISGTEIVLKPDTAIFGETAFSQEILSRWLEVRLSENLNITATVNSDD